MTNILRDKVVKISICLLLIFAGLSVYNKPLSSRNVSDTFLIVDKDETGANSGKYYITGISEKNGKELIFEVSESKFEELDVDDVVGVDYEDHLYLNGRHEYEINYFTNVRR